MVLTELTAGALCVHRPGEHGYANDSGADAAEELVELALAKDKNISVTEPFAGGHAFDHALMIGGPTPAFYEAMLGEQQSREAAAAPPPVSKRLAEAAKRALRRTLDAFPPETFFDDAGGDASARNNGAAVIDLQVNGDRMLFTSDVGVPGLTNALDYLDSIGRSGPVKMFQLPHHASRHNLDRDTIERVLGPRTPQRRGTAVASVSKDSSNPAPRVANAAGRRGFRVFTTVNGLRHYGDGAPERPNWSPAEPLPPLAETD